MISREVLIGPLCVTITLDEAGRLRSVELPERVPASLSSSALKEVIAELSAYPISFEDTPAFSQRVWQRMREIPSGTSMTYQQLATALGNPGAMRAVGQACARNRHLLVIPCHRVVAKNGLGGFALGLEWKEALLELESQ